jgi:hypothetical protein
MTGDSEITNSQDTIDSRDIIKRIEYLEDTEDEDEKQELANLEALQEQAEGYSEWQEGAQLIRDSYFEEYAQEFAGDIGAIGKDNQWPLYCIDWEKAARELQMDYTCVDFDGVEYWVR